MSQPLEDIRVGDIMLYGGHEVRLSDFDCRGEWTVVSDAGTWYRIHSDILRNPEFRVGDKVRWRGFDYEIRTWGQVGQAHMNSREYALVKRAPVSDTVKQKQHKKADFIIEAWKQWPEHKDDGSCTAAGCGVCAIDKAEDTVPDNKRGFTPGERVCRAPGAPWHALHGKVGKVKKLRPIDTAGSDGWNTLVLWDNGNSVWENPKNLEMTDLPLKGDRQCVKCDDPPEPGCVLCTACMGQVNKPFVKHDESKPRMDLLPPLALKAMARVLTLGSYKYSDHNWRNIPREERSRLVASLLRHVTAAMAGEDNDAESGASHWAHAMANAAFLCELFELDKIAEDKFRR